MESQVSTYFKEFPWNSVEFDEILWDMLEFNRNKQYSEKSNWIQRISMKYGGFLIQGNSIKCYRIPGNSVELIEIK